MANDARFITKQYMIDNSPLSGNVDANEVYPFAKTAEKLYIQDAIGTNLFDDLISKIIAGTLNANEVILCKKIREAVLWYTLFDAIPFIALKIRNIGIVKQTGEGHESASRQDLNVLRDECKKKGDFFLERVQAYLCENKSLFPAYTNGTDDDLPKNELSPTPSCDIAFENDITDDYRRFYRKWLES
jgi:hypothetical protein